LDVVAFGDVSYVVGLRECSGERGRKENDGESREIVVELHLENCGG
jgi:hypothetical protein